MLQKVVWTEARLILMLGISVRKKKVQYKKRKSSLAVAGVEIYLNEK